jgi:hypothetical protein
MARLVITSFHVAMWVNARGGKLKWNMMWLTSHNLKRDVVWHEKINQKLLGGFINKFTTIAYGVIFTPLGFLGITFFVWEVSSHLGIEENYRNFSKQEAVCSHHSCAQHLKD